VKGPGVQFEALSENRGLVFESYLPKCSTTFAEREATMAGLPTKPRLSKPQLEQNFKSPLAK